jgi:hypothetical protein
MKRKLQIFALPGILCKFIVVISETPKFYWFYREKITKFSEEKMKNRSRSFAIFRSNFASALYTYDGLERLENSAPLGPGCGGRAEESHLLCIKLHRDLAYKRPRRPQSLLLRIRIVLMPILIRIRIQLHFKVMGICDHWSIDLQGSILSPQASIVSVHGPTWLCFEPLKLLNFEFIADPDQLFTLMPIRIRIQLITLMPIWIRI